MTDEQVEKATDIFRAGLRKHRTEFCAFAVQRGLETGELGPNLLAVFRRCVEAVNNLIVRPTPVNRSRTPQEAISSTGRQRYITNEIVEAMPRGAGEEAELIFFRVGRHLSDNELAAEYKLRNLKPADPYSLAAANEADPAFADTHPNGTHWKDANGCWCYAAFDRWLVGERYVGVGRHGSVWIGDWWFAGLRK